MRNLQAVSLAIVMAVAVGPTFAATPANPPAARCPRDQAIHASVLNAFFTPAVTAAPATTSTLPPQLGGTFYGYCSQDCTPCYSGDPYPQCPPDIYSGNGQSCLQFQGC
jgi:hypothetical protein